MQALILTTGMSTVGRGGAAQELGRHNPTVGGPDPDRVGPSDPAKGEEIKRGQTFRRLRRATLSKDRLEKGVAFDR